MATVFSDSFSSADVFLHTHNAVWVQHPSFSSGNLYVTAAGKVRAHTSAGSAMYYLDQAAGSNDYTVGFDVVCVTTVEAAVQAMLRMSTSENTGYRVGVSHSGGVRSLQCTRFSAGTSAAVGSSHTVTLTAGTTKRLTASISGTNPTIIAVNFDGVDYEFSDATGLPATQYVGLRAYASGTPTSSTGLQIDNFTLDVTAAGSPPAGTVTISSVTPGSTTASVTYSYDDTDQTGFEYRIDAGTAASIGASPATITGLAASTEYDIEVRAVNVDGAGSWSSINTFTTGAAAVPSVTVAEPLKNNTGTVLASQSGVKASVLSAATLESVYEASGLTTNGSGVLSAISNAAITTGQSYHVAIKLADGSVGITGPITAS